jgi:hypothetical protein
MTDERDPPELPPLRLRSRRRILPELELDLRRPRKPRDPESPGAEQPEAPATAWAEIETPGERVFDQESEATWEAEPGDLVDVAEPDLDQSAVDEVEVGGAAVDANLGEDWDPGPDEWAAEVEPEPERELEPEPDVDRSRLSAVEALRLPPPAPAPARLEPSEPEAFMPVAVPPEPAPAPPALDDELVDPPAATIDEAAAAPTEMSPPASGFVSPSVAVLPTSRRERRRQAKATAAIANELPVLPPEPPLTIDASRGANDEPLTAVAPIPGAVAAAAPVLEAEAEPEPEPEPVAVLDPEVEIDVPTLDADAPAPEADAPVRGEEWHPETPMIAGPSAVDVTPVPLSRRDRKREAKAAAEADKAERAAAAVAAKAEQARAAEAAKNERTGQKAAAKSQRAEAKASKRAKPEAPPPAVAAEVTSDPASEVSLEDTSERAIQPIVAMPDAEPPATTAAAMSRGPKRPLYWRLLRLRHVQPNGWQRALLIEGVIGVAVVLVLAGVATIWTIPALPIVAAVLVKLNDVVVGALNGPPTAREAPTAETDVPESAPDGAELEATKA